LKIQDYSRLERCRSKSDELMLTAECLTLLATKKSLARKTQFAEPIQCDLGRPVIVRKIFRFALAPNQWLPSARPASV
jgi:hypothetical protein